MRFIGAPGPGRYSVALKPVSIFPAAHAADRLSNSLQEVAMHPTFAASALCLGLLVFAAQPAASQNPEPSNAPVSTTAGDAAAKHAKRTGCLKESKARKLVGAEKAAFLKDCIGAPPEAISANRISSQDRP